MARPLDTLAKEALALPEADRLALATELIDSVEGPVDSGWDAAWLAELEARRQQGTDEAVPWTEVRDRVLGRLRSSPG